MAVLFGVARWQVCLERLLGRLDGVNWRSSKAFFGLQLLKGKLDVLASAVTLFSCHWLCCPGQPGLHSHSVILVKERHLWKLKPVVWEIWKPLLILSLICAFRKQWTSRYPCHVHPSREAHVFFPIAQNFREALQASGREKGVSRPCPLGDSTVGARASWGGAVRKVQILWATSLSPWLSPTPFTWSANKSPRGPSGASPFLPCCTSFWPLTGGQRNVLRRQEAGRRKTKAWPTLGVGNRSQHEWPYLGALLSSPCSWMTHAHTRTARVHVHLLTRPISTS